ncbi:MAG: hypothetical protein U1A27_03935 [Phycisphaerae bacterium]
MKACLHSTMRLLRVIPLFGLLSSLSCGLFGGGGPSSTMFVVNNNFSVTSYSPANENGEVAPDTELPAGGSTDIFQPRAILISPSQELFVGRANGGITIHENALTATGNTHADRIIEGPATKLDSPIAFAYDATHDRLYVGNTSADDGILRFDDVSDPTFDGNLAPDEEFNPPDRAPSDVAPMTISDMELDDNDRLYVADSSGLFVNSSRILVFTSAGTRSGEVAPSRTITCTAWDVIEDFALGNDGRLYVLDGSNHIFIFDNASTLNNAVTPSRTATISGVGVALRGITFDSTGRAYVADGGNSEIHTFTSLGTTSGTATPATTLSGADTRLFSPRHMSILE